MCYKVVRSQQMETDRVLTEPLCQTSKLEWEVLAVRLFLRDINDTFRKKQVVVFKGRLPVDK